MFVCFDFTSLQSSSQISMLIRQCIYTSGYHLGQTQRPSSLASPNYQPHPGQTQRPPSPQRGAVVWVVRPHSPVPPPGSVPSVSLRTLFNTRLFIILHILYNIKLSVVTAAVFF